MCYKWVWVLPPPSLALHCTVDFSCGTTTGPQILAPPSFFVILMPLRDNLRSWFSGFVTTVTNVCEVKLHNHTFALHCHHMKHFDAAGLCLTYWSFAESCYVEAWRDLLVDSVDSFAPKGNFSTVKVAPTCRKDMLWDWLSWPLTSSFALCKAVTFILSLFVNLPSSFWLAISSWSTSSCASFSSWSSKSRICWYTAVNAVFLSAAHSHSPLNLPQTQLFSEIRLMDTMDTDHNSTITSL